MSAADTLFATARRADVLADIERESMSIRCRQSIQSLPSMAVVLTITGALLWGTVDSARLLGWVGACFAMTALRAGVCALILPRLASVSREQLTGYERWLASTTIANTLAMGSGVWWVAAIGSIEVQYFVTLTTCLYSVGSLVNASTNAPIFIAGVAANLGQTIAFWALHGLDGIKIAIPLVVIALLLVAFGRANARAFAESVRMRYQNLDLVASFRTKRRPSSMRFRSRRSEPVEIAFLGGGEPRSAPAAACTTPPGGSDRAGRRGWTGPQVGRSDTRNAGIA
jgi:hypothetical protein